MISHFCLSETRRLPSAHLFSSRREQIVANGKIVSPVLCSSSPRDAGKTRCDLTFGLDRPTTHFGHRTVCKSGVAPAQHGVLLASKLIVVPCATSCSLGTCSVAKGDHEGDGYGDLCLSCARHPPALQIAIETLRNTHVPQHSEASKMKKVNNNVCRLAYKKS